MPSCKKGDITSQGWILSIPQRADVRFQKTGVKVKTIFNLFGYFLLILPIILDSGSPNYDQTTNQSWEIVFLFWCRVVIGTGDTPLTPTTPQAPPQPPSWELHGNKCICLPAPETQADTLNIGRWSSYGNITLNELRWCDSSQAAPAPGGRWAAAGTDGLTVGETPLVLLGCRDRKKMDFGGNEQCSIVERIIFVLFVAWHSVDKMGVWPFIDSAALLPTSPTGDDGSNLVTAAQDAIT